MNQNKKPGPRGKRRRAADGTFCPPGSEGTRVYRGARAFRKVCRVGGHPKLHPGRCVICRRLSDKARDMKPSRAEAKAAASKRWLAKPDSKAKRAAAARARNARREQKDASAARQRLYRRGFKVDNPGNPSDVAAKLLAKAERQAKQARYGIIGQINLERR